ncbi:MAG: transcription initiation factor IIB [Candidatus Verstraetearchaeota archaeon]|nr:transcription initiation factor IIB [Candidatus Verstraetearchaeota archaeon]
MQKHSNLDEIVCPECKCNTLIKDEARAEIICTSCGLVINERMLDLGPEWRNFSNNQENKRSRVGAPLTLTIHDKGLSTIIDWRNKDGHGNSLTLKKKIQIYRLRKWQQRTRISSANERNLIFALSEIERMISQLALPRSVQEASALIYRKAVENQLIRGRSIESITGAVLYIACRQCNIPVTLDDISKVCKANKKEIARNYRFLLNELMLKVSPMDPVNYIPRIITKLNLDGLVQKISIDIVKAMEKARLISGKGPMGIAAAAVYITSVIMDRKRTQRDIANVAKVTEVTLRHRYKEILEKIDLEIFL